MKLEPHIEMEANNKEKGNNNKTMSRSRFSDVIERSVVLQSSKDAPQCGICGKPVFSESLQSETWPSFCSECGNWYHHRCIHQASSSDSNIAPCPQCSTGCFILKSHFYCNTCGSQEIKKDTFWPDAHCSKCDEKGFLAALTDIGIREKGILVIIGVLSFVFLCTVAIFIHCQTLTLAAKIIAGLFALPWILMGVVFSIAELFFPHGNPVMKRACGLKNRLLRDDNKFRNRNFAYRYARAYAWVLVNSLDAILVFGAIALVVKIMTSK